LASLHETLVVALEISRSRFVQVSVRRGANLVVTPFLEVDYEAVVEDVERESRRMLNFFGLPWNERVLRFHETERPVRTASVNQVRQPIYCTSAGRWRRRAPHLQPLLAALGVPSS
jgi:hypothetical protein